MIDKWAKMGIESKDEFVNNLSSMPQDIQNEVISKLKEKGKDIPKELQKGIDEVELSKEIKLDVDSTSAKQKFNKIFGANGSIGKILNSIGIKLPTIQFAVGGMPEVGQLFVANEKGPELVGQIGGQSFVANQNQMMDLLDRKIGNVQGNNRSNDVYNIYLDANHKIGSYTLEQLQGMAKTNGKPISIG